MRVSLGYTKPSHGGDQRRQIHCVGRWPGAIRRFGDGPIAIRNPGTRRIHNRSTSEKVRCWRAGPFPLLVARSLLLRDRSAVARAPVRPRLAPVSPAARRDGDDRASCSSLHRRPGHATVALAAERNRDAPSPSDPAPVRTVDRRTRSTVRSEVWPKGVVAACRRTHDTSSGLAAGRRRWGASPVTSARVDAGVVAGVEQRKLPDIAIAALAGGREGDRSLHDDVRLTLSGLAARHRS